MLDYFKQYFSRDPHNDGAIQCAVPFGFTGFTMPWHNETPPAGYLIMDGSTYKIDDYPELANHLGDAAIDPGDSTKFILPDYSGRTPVGVDGSTDVLDEDGSDAHIHTLSDEGYAKIGLGAGGTPVVGLDVVVPSYAVSRRRNITGSTGSSDPTTTATPLAGNTDPASAITPNIRVLWVIKT